MWFVLSMYLRNKSVEMKFRYLKAILYFGLLGHPIGNRFKNGHIVGINKLMGCPINLCKF